MEKYLLLAVGAALVNNVVLIKVLGLCPVFGLSRKFETALSLGLMTAFTLSVVTGASYLMNEYVLVPLELEYLRTLVFMLMIIGCAGFADWRIRKTFPLLHQTLGIYVPLSVVNCAALGVPFLNLQEKHKFLESVFYGLGAAIGFTIVLMMFSSLRERLEGANVPRAFRGSAIAMITAGLLSLGFMGFYGLVK